MAIDSALTEAVFELYSIPWPSGSGDRRSLCPVHEESRPSASVNTETGLWHCFSCGAAGDAYTIVMMREGVKYTDAVTRVEGIADEGGSSVRGTSDRESSRYLSKRQGHTTGSQRYVPSWLRK